MKIAENFQNQFELECTNLFFRLMFFSCEVHKFNPKSNGKSFKDALLNICPKMHTRVVSFSQIDEKKNSFSHDQILS